MLLRLDLGRVGGEDRTDQRMFEEGAHQRGRVEAGVGGAPWNA